jgi:hypothetical protein
VVTATGVVFVRHRTTATGIKMADHPTFALRSRQVHLYPNEARPVPV